MEVNRNTIIKDLIESHPETLAVFKKYNLVIAGGVRGPNEPIAFFAKAHAFLRGRGYITPEDIKAIGPDVLRHRVLVTYEAEAEEKTSDDIVQKVFDTIEVP